MADKQSAKTNELAEHFPAPKEIRVRVNIAAKGAAPKWEERSMRIDEFEITQIGQIAGIMRAMGADSKLFESDNVLSFVLSLAAEHDAELIQAVAIALRMPADDVRRFAASSFIEAAIAVYETNRDFFVQSLASHVSALMATLTRLMPTIPSGANGAGSTQSPSFESTAASPSPNVSH